MKIVFLTTDSYHHWYFLNFLKLKKIHFNAVISETEKIIPSFDVEADWEKNIEIFEKKRWKKMIEVNVSELQYVKNINNNSSKKILKSLRPDFGIVFGTRKINKSVISLFRLGLINIHRGITNEYRGLDCDLWPIYHNDYENLGVTIHKVDNDLDTGEIIEQEKVNLTRDFECYKLRAMTTELAANLLVEIIRKLKKTQKVDCSPLKRKGRYYSFMPKCLKIETEKKLIKYLNKK